MQDILLALLCLSHFSEFRSGHEGKKSPLLWILLFFTENSVFCQQGFWFFIRAPVSVKKNNKRKLLQQTKLCSYLQSLPAHTWQRKHRDLHTVVKLLFELYSHSKKGCFLLSNWCWVMMKRLFKHLSDLSECWHFQQRNINCQTSCEASEKFDAHYK